jgi:hypothetical protein
VVLFISGRITGKYVDMVRTSLEQESGVLAMDLKDFSLVDPRAVQFLAFSEAKGAELRNCPASIREWVTRERKRMSRRNTYGEEK